ncbi:MAG: hypothetical protein KDK97_13050 [Verrucomicrobiales bacterium]|nr:hypothetical protein [Verrucomicrobiales bacterium]
MKWIFLAILTVVVMPSAAREVQSHGIFFERWLGDNFFGGYVPHSYTQKWDIPAGANREHGGIPVNPKAIKYGTPIDMGDALRQFKIDETFLLIVGFWEQPSPEVKTWVNAQAITVTPEVWRKLWGDITEPDLEKLVAVIKDKSLTLEQARAKAKAMKGVAPFTNAVIQVNPKIDGSQRRLQCSIRFDDFFQHLVPEGKKDKVGAAKVFGRVIPPVAAPPRTITAPSSSH